MRILAIETSCDDTGIAILEIRNSKFEIRSNVVSSQAIHQNYGGVFPMMAKREHQKNLVPVMIESLSKAKLLAKKKRKIINDPILNEIFKKEPELLKFTQKFLAEYEKPEVDLIAVTNGPGLEPCLWTGVNFARVLSYFWDIPIIPVNHIEAHILINFLPKVNENSKLEIRNSKLTTKKLFPAISLVVSGGHTQLILVKGVGKYKIIGETRDDAAGECFDKCAKILGLGYPGGPIVAKLASQRKFEIRNSEFEINLPRPMMHTKDYDFSFSGLKTAVLYETKGKELTKEYVGQVCFEVQQAIIDVLIKKTIKAVKDFSAKGGSASDGKVKTVILGGGVSANKELRKQLGQALKKENPAINYIIPDAKLSTDNGLMIAMAAALNPRKKAAWRVLAANANLRVGS